MQRTWPGAIVLIIVVGCSSGTTTNPRNDGSADVAAVSDVGVDVGVTDVGADTATLPACAVATRPPEPDPSGLCNTYPITGGFVTAQPYQLAADGGVADDGGVVIVARSGGTVFDGDYDLVQVWNNGSPLPDRRTLRFFDHGTHVEWAVVDQTGGSVRRNTTISTSGTTLTIVSTDCGPAATTTTYHYAASSDELTMFFDQNPITPDQFSSVYTYQRTCAR